MSLLRYTDLHMVLEEALVKIIHIVCSFYRILHFTQYLQHNRTYLTKEKSVNYS